VQQWALFKKLEATKAYKRARNPCKVAVTCLRPYAFRVAAVAVAVSGAEEGSADDVVGWAGAPGSRFQAAKLALMSGLMSWTAGEAVKTTGCTQGKYFAEPNRCLCGSLHCLDQKVVGSFEIS
jgi:hypothetical protein